MRVLACNMPNRGHGPVGHVAWKHYGGQENPFADPRAEAAQVKYAWVPVKAGLFRGSHERFEVTAARYEKEFPV